MDDILSKLFENIKHCLLSLTVQLGLPEISPSLIESIIRLGDGSRKGDIILIFASPFLKPYCSRLSVIGEIFLDESKKWQIPLKNFTIKTSARHPNQPSILVLNLDRKITIDNILNSKKCENIQTKSKILLDWSSHHADEWIKLRFNYIIDFIINLNQLSNFKIILKRKSDINNVNAIQDLRLDPYENNENFSKPYRIDSDFEGQIIPALKNCISKLSYDPKSAHQYFLMDQLLQDLQNYEELIILIKLRELFEFQKLLLTWIKLRNLQENLIKVNFISVGDIHSDISHSQFCSSLNEYITEQRQFKYPSENLEALINCCVRYSVLSIAPHINNHIDRNKYKQALFAQYNYARLENILKKFKKINLDDRPLDLTIIESSKEWELIMKYIIFFPKLINQILTDKKVHKLTIFLNNLSNDLSLYYHKTRILVQFNNRTIPIIKARINFAYKIQEIIKTCLYLMGCQVVDFM